MYHGTSDSPVATVDSAAAIPTVELPPASDMAWQLLISTAKDSPRNNKIKMMWWAFIFPYKTLPLEFTLIP